MRASTNEGTNKAQQGQPSKARTRPDNAREKRKRKRPFGTLILFTKPIVNLYCTRAARRAERALIR
jgi:hypothetical protein